MNKILKFVIVLFNLAMLIFAFLWYQDDNNQYEPKIVMLGQFLVLIGLFCESGISKIINKKISKSTIDIDIVSGDIVKNNKIKSSNIKIKTRK